MKEGRIYYLKKKKDDIKCKNVLQTTGTIGTC